MFKAASEQVNVERRRLNSHHINVISRAHRLTKYAWQRHEDFQNRIASCTIKESTPIEASAVPNTTEKAYHVSLKNIVALVFVFVAPLVADPHYIQSLAFI